MKIYIVTSGSYSDYSINAVFLDKEQADKYCDHANLINDSASVEVFDEGWPGEAAGMVAKRYYRAVVTVLTGELHSYSHEFYTWARPEDKSWCMEFDCSADKIPYNIEVLSYVSEEHAKKVAVEKRQEIIRNCGGIDKLEKSDNSYWLQVRR